MTGSADAHETAAIAAAVARFEAETAAAPAEDGAALSPWQRTALLEGVSGIGVVVETEGGSRWLS